MFLSSYVSKKEVLHGYRGGGGQFNYTKFFGINALFIFFSMTLSKDTCNKLGLSKSPES
jgi:hypothetical protein